MKKSQTQSTTAKNLEEKFERGDDVLDYFDVGKARLIKPVSRAAAKGKATYSVKRNSDRQAVVREKSGPYHKKK